MAQHTPPSPVRVCVRGRMLEPDDTEARAAAEAAEAAAAVKAAVEAAVAAEAEAALRAAEAAEQEKQIAEAQAAAAAARKKRDELRKGALFMAKQIGSQVKVRRPCALHPEQRCADPGAERARPPRHRRAPLLTTVPQRPLGALRPAPSGPARAPLPRPLPLASLARCSARMPPHPHERAAPRRAAAT